MENLQVTDRYRVNMRRLGFLEVWRWGRPRSFLQFVAAKCLGLPMMSSQDIVVTPGVAWLEADAVRDDLKQATQPVLTAVLESGFDMVSYYRTCIQTWVSDAENSIAIAAIDPEGRAVCLVAFVAAPDEHATVSVISRLPGGRYLASGQGGRLFSPPPEIDALRLPGRSPAQVIAAHYKRLKSQEVVPIARSGVEALIVDMQKVMLAHNVRRGLWVPVEPEDGAEQAG